MRFIIRVIVNAFAIWVVTLIPALMTVVTPFAPGETLQLVLSLLAVAAVFAIVNSIIGTVIKIVAFPLYILTLGLISFLVNGLLKFGLVRVPVGDGVVDARNGGGQGGEGVGHGGALRPRSGGADVVGRCARPVSP